MIDPASAGSFFSVGNFRQRRSIWRRAPLSTRLAFAGWQRASDHSHGGVTEKSRKAARSKQIGQTTKGDGESGYYSV